MFACDREQGTPDGNFLLMNHPLTAACIEHQMEPKRTIGDLRERSRRAGGKSEESSAQRFWSQEVTRTSNALDLEPGVFTWDDPAAIAQSLKRSAEVSTRRKGTPLQSAMSMLNFYINRAGRNLPAERREILERAKAELRRAFHHA